MSAVGPLYGGSFLKEAIETGYAILAEIYRLAECIPEDFKNPKNSRFKPFLIDFAYFEDLTVIDRYVDGNEQGAQLEDEFLYTYEKVIKRFGALFDAIARFFSDLIEYAENDRSDNVMLSVRRTAAFISLCQQEAEILFVAGVILLALDEKFTSSVKQRLFVSHYRCNASSDERYDILVDVLKVTANREELFRKLPINRSFVNSVLTALRTDVLFSDEEELHACELSPRGIRASLTQRAYLSVCLFFEPSLLHSEPVIMRQIVDTFFAEEWVIHLHMGMVLNIVDAWDRYKAANVALQHTLNNATVRQLAADHARALSSAVFPQTAKLTPAELVAYADIIAASNRHLQWLMLHSYRPEKLCKRAAQLQETVSGQLTATSLNLFNILLSIATFEYGYKELFSALLANKEERVKGLKKEICEHISQMAEMFANENPLQRIKKNVTEKLRSWLMLVEKTVSELNVANADAASLIAELKARLEQVSDMHDLSGIVAVSQYLHTIHALLSKLSHYCVLDEAYYGKVESITNFAYGWTIVSQWFEDMERLVKSDPLSIRSLFVKLAGSISVSLKRLETPERVSALSMCYSGHLEERLRKILQAVPRSLFALLDKVAELLNPPRTCAINKSDVRHFADSERRLQLAATTHSISMLSLGISTMQLTQLGSLRVDPSTLLLDGIRRELVTQIYATLHTLLVSDLPLDDLLTKLKDQFAHLRGAFVYMCEHIAINGAVIWHNELARIIGYMVERECNTFLRHPISDEESLFQSRSAPIPHTPTDGFITPLSRLYTHLLNASNPKIVYYVNSLRMWCDLKTKKALLSNESLDAVQEALSPMALWALDRLAAFNIVKYLYVLHNQLLNMLIPSMISALADVASVDGAPLNTRFKVFDSALAKFLPNSSRIIGLTSMIGQLQLLRQQLIEKTRTVVRQRSPNVYNALSALNDSILNDIRSNRGKCDEELLNELSELLQRCALTNPLQKIYITREAPQLFTATMLLVLLSAVAKFNVLKKADSTDISAFCAGFACILLQFNALRDFFVLCGSYTSAVVLTARSVAKQASMIAAIRFIARYASVNLDDVEGLLNLSMVTEGKS